MTRSEEQELLELTKQNHYLLTVICTAVLNNTNDAFIQDVIANLVANRVEGGMYAKRSNSNNDVQTIR
jgi:hypothetical protein